MNISHNKSKNLPKDTKDRENTPLQRPFGIRLLEIKSKEILRFTSQKATSHHRRPHQRRPHHVSQKASDVDAGRRHVLRHHRRRRRERRSRPAATVAPPAAAAAEAARRRQFPLHDDVVRPTATCKNMKRYRRSKGRNWSKNVMKERVLCHHDYMNTVSTCQTKKATLGRTTMTISGSRRH